MNILRNSELLSNALDRKTEIDQNGKKKTHHGYGNLIWDLIWNFIVSFILIYDLLCNKKSCKARSLEGKSWHSKHFLLQSIKIWRWNLFYLLKCFTLKSFNFFLKKVWHAWPVSSTKKSFLTCLFWGNNL